jgi:hypothetical protein
MDGWVLEGVDECPTRESRDGPDVLTVNRIDRIGKKKMYTIPKS